jgi:SAM-dependent methyltransferase
MYDFSWHQSHGDLTLSSAKYVVPILRSLFELQSVLDVGCGDGRWLAAFNACGVSDIAGIDGPWTDVTKLYIEPSNFQVRELAKPFHLGRKFSLAVSLEVAEHIEPDAAKVFVQNMVRHSDVILFGAAIPFQGGFRHVNERWQSFWADLFAEQDFTAFDPLRRQLWDRTDISLWYKQNMLLYVNRACPDLVARVSHYIDSNGIAQMPLNVVHPERYTSIASYSQIAFKPLLQKLPRATLRKLTDVILRRI